MIDFKRYSWVALGTLSTNLAFATRFLNQLKAKRFADRSALANSLTVFK